MDQPTTLNSSREDAVCDSSQLLQQQQQQQQQSRLSDVSYHIENEPLLNNNNNNNNTMTGGQKVKFDGHGSNESLQDPEAATGNSSDDKIRFIDDDGHLVNAKHVQSANNTTREANGGQKNSPKRSKLKYNSEHKSIQSDPNTIGKGLFSLLKTIRFYQDVFVEFFATFLLVLYVCSFGLPISDPSHIDIPASINGALGSGLIVASLVWAFAHVGGANLNPAVTIALFLTGESNLLRVLFYIPAQMLGSVMAAICLRELVPEHISYALNYKEMNRESVLAATNNATQQLKIVKPIPIGITLLNSSITPFQGFGVEVIITFILIIAVFACTDKRRTDLGGSFPLTIGFAVTLGILFGGKFTGGSMNPARSFGPAFIMDNWENHWIYWAGPISGAIIAGYTYKLLMLGRKTA